MSDKELIATITEILTEKSSRQIIDLKGTDVLREVMDSLDYWDALLEMEWRLGVVFNDDEAKNIKTLNHLVETVAQKLN